MSRIKIIVLKNFFSFIWLMLGFLAFFMFPVNQAHAQFAGDLGRVTGSIHWGNESASLGTTNSGFGGGYFVNIVGSTSGFSKTLGLIRGTVYDTGYNLPPDTYTVTVSAGGYNGSDPFVVGTQTVTVNAQQSTIADFDTSQTTGIVEGNLKINGTPSEGSVQFCAPAPASCPTNFINQNGFHVDFGSSGFRIPMLPGNYRVHVITSTGLDVGIVPIPVATGQIVNDSSLQYQLNLGRISDSMHWGTDSVSIGVNSGFYGGYFVSLVGNTTGYSTNLGLIRSQNFDTDYSLPADTYIETVSVAGFNGNNPFVVGTQTVTVNAGQSTIADFDMSQTTGLVKGNLMINGVPSEGSVQFCAPDPAPCPTNFVNGNGYWVSFLSNGFSIPLLPGNYRVHVITSAGSDVGIVPITVAAGQIVNDSSLQFQLNFGKISGSIHWGNESTTLGTLNSSLGGGYFVNVVGNTNGYSTTLGLLRSTTYDTGYNLPPDIYTVTVSAGGYNGSDPFVVGTQTVKVSSGQSTTVDFDTSQTTGLVEGNLTINGVPSEGSVQFCAPDPAPCPTSFDNQNGFHVDFGSSGFRIPMLPGNYRVHVINILGVEMGIVNTIVTRGAKDNLNTKTIRGTVYNDINQNGLQDTGEEGYVGATVILDSGESTTTDSNGNYSFNNLSSGIYVETLSVPNGYNATTTNPVSISLSADITQNFGIVPLLTPTPVPDQPPSVKFTAGSTLNEGDIFTATGSFTDPDSSSWTATVAYGDGSGVQNLPLTGNNFSLSHVYKDNGNYTVIVSVTDNQGATGTETATVTVNNVVPSVSAITVPSPVWVKGSVLLSVNFTDPGILDTHMASIDWGDGMISTGTVIENNGSGSVSGDHVYFAKGVYTITVTVTDKDGGVGTEIKQITVNNRPPFVNPFSDAAVNQGQTYTATGTFTDSDSTSWTATVDYGDGAGPQKLALNSDKTFNLSHQYNTAGTYIVTVVVTDDSGGTGTTSATVTVNAPPTINPITGGTINEGQTYNENGSFTDSDSSSWTGTVSYDDGVTWESLPITGNSFTLNHLYKDNKPRNAPSTVTIRITDDQGATAEQTLQVIVNNANPQVGAITASINPVQVNQSTTATASFTDAGVLDTHLVTKWNWGDGFESNGNVTEANGSGSVSGDHVYLAPGVYTVTLTVWDKDGGSGQSTFQYISAYNPTPQGLFSGARIFQSPAGAYTADPSLTGQVQFGVTAKYDTNNQPTGNVSMKFNAAGFTFNATTITVFVTANGKATLMGTGTINGSGNYNFLVTGIDSTTDTIRFQIVDSSNKNAVVYDSQPSAAATDDPTAAVTGQVVIH